MAHEQQYPDPSPKQPSEQVSEIKLFCKIAREIRGNPGWTYGVKYDSDGESGNWKSQVRYIYDKFPAILGYSANNSTHSQRKDV